MLTDWIELCELFNARNVEYLLIGGQAVIAHGYPRLTKDINLWIGPTLGNGQRVLKAMKEFGVTPPGFTAKRFEDPKTMIMLGNEPFRIDLMTSIPGVDFQLAWKKRKTVVLDGVSIPLISKEDLITNKKEVGRLQDLADVEALESIVDDD